MHAKRIGFGGRRNVAADSGHSSLPVSLGMVAAAYKPGERRGQLRAVRQKVQVSSGRRKKEARHMAGLPKCVLGILRSGCLVLDTFVGSALFGRFRTAPRALGDPSLDLLDRPGFITPRHRRDLTEKPSKTAFVKRPLQKGLPRLGLRP